MLIFLGKSMQAWQRIRCDEIFWTYMVCAVASKQTTDYSSPVRIVEQSKQTEEASVGA